MLPQCKEVYRTAQEAGSNCCVGRAGVLTFMAAFSLFSVRASSLVTSVWAKTV